VEDNAPSPDFDEFWGKTFGPTSSIFVYDKCQAQRSIICKIISAAGARAIGMTNVQQPPCSAKCCIAVVGISTEIDGDELRIIRELKAAGFRVIACGEDVESWSVKVRCLPLLAGAGQLLDKAATGFTDCLCRALKQALVTETKNQQEAQQIKSTMRTMDMLGESAAMMGVFRRVVSFSRLSDLPVLITGETGTGKEGLARALHQLDRKRCTGPFVPVNCGAIVQSLAESEFFGHRRGAFTGAERSRKGLIRSADTGVLFLDEIGELDAVLQAKLLRVLEDSRVLGVGEDSDVKVDIRVVAATSRDLEKMGRAGSFRTDLFHRLNVLSIEVPALHERTDDLLLLTEYFLEKYRTLNATVSVIGIGAEFLEALRQLELPGNVRQLENIVRQALARRETNDPLGLRDLSVELLRQLSESAPSPQTAPQIQSEFERAEIAKDVVRLLEVNEWNLSRSLEACERLAMEGAMRRAAGNQSKAARLLGITPRSVYNKMRKHRLRFSKVIIAALWPTMPMADTMDLICWTFC
jgi:DNA-binding NtrC family response regulator